MFEPSIFKNVKIMVVRHINLELFSGPSKYIKNAHMVRKGVYEE